MSVGYTALADLRGLRVESRVPALRVAAVRLPDARAAARLRRRPGIRFVQRAAPRHSTDGSVLAPADWQWSATHADAVPAWVTAAAARLTIAVIDTGADTSVPALAAKAPVTYNVATRTSAIHDTIGHGTFVASLAAEFGGDARLMVVQANRGGSSFTDIDEAAAIIWAVDHGARIVNLSIGGSRTSAVERAAVNYAVLHGALLVAAAGNTAQQGNPVTYPAALIGRRGLVVGAATQAGGRAGFSTTGAYVDLLAPGVNVLGALAGGIATTLYSPGGQDGFGLGSGTSYAAPEVAGAAALVWAANPLLDARAVASLLETTASGNGVWTKDLAYGTLDVAAAVQRAVDGSR